MAEITHCPSCQRKLSVPENLLGQSVQCPSCLTTFTASLARPAPQYSPPAAPPPMQDPYKPHQPGNPQPPTAYDSPPYDQGYPPQQMPYSAPPPSRSRGRSSRRYYQDYYDDSPQGPQDYYDEYEDDYEDDYDTWRRRKRRDLVPHRGETILMLGIFSLICSFVNFCYVFALISAPTSITLGIIAWVMANHDLKEIKAGQMDPSGEGNAQGGRICGIIGLSMTGIEIMFGIAIIILIALN